MKKLLLICLLMSGCCSAPRVEPKGVEFDCASLTPHGVYAHYKITATSLDSALKLAQEVNDKLVSQNVIPNCFVDCHIAQ